MFLLKTSVESAMVTQNQYCKQSSHQQIKRFEKIFAKAEIKTPGSETGSNIVVESGLNNVGTNNVEIPDQVAGPGEEKCKRKLSSKQPEEEANPKVTNTEDDTNTKGNY